MAAESRILPTSGNVFGASDNGLHGVPTPGILLHNSGRPGAPAPRRYGACDSRIRTANAG